MDFDERLTATEREKEEAKRKLDRAEEEMYQAKEEMYQAKGKVNRAEEEMYQAEAEYKATKEKMKRLESEMVSNPGINKEYEKLEKEVGELQDVYKSKQHLFNTMNSTYNNLVTSHNNLITLYDKLLEYNTALTQRIPISAIPKHVTEEIDCSISEVSSAVLYSIFSNYNIDVIEAPFAFDSELLVMEIPPFTWDASHENSNNNRPRYLEFIQKNILDDIEDFPMTAFNVNGVNDLLNTDFGIRKVKGTCDVIISSTKTEYVQLQYCHIVIELKKEVKPKHFKQAELELVCADIHSKYNVLAVLTDLNNDWVFYWLEKSGENGANIVFTKVPRVTAISYLRYHVQWVAKKRRKQASSLNFKYPDPFEDEDNCDGDEEQKVVKRQKLMLSKRPTFSSSKHPLFHKPQSGNDHNMSVDQIRRITIDNFLRRYENDLPDWIVHEKPEIVVDSPDSKELVSDWLGKLPNLEKERAMKKLESSTTLI